MKKTIFFFFVLLLCRPIAAQDSEFKVYPNGLIYSPQTMGKLSRIVDSLNLKHKSCQSDPVYYATQQTLGEIVRLKGSKVTAAMQDMQAQMPLAEFLKKYPQAEVEHQVLILRSKYRNYKNKEITEIEQMDPVTDYGFRIHSEDPSVYTRDFQNTWLFEHHSGSDDSKASVSAFYFPAKFQAPRLPKTYAGMIAYADCLVDTTVPKFKKDAEYGQAYLPDNWAALSMKKKKELLEKMRSTRVMGGCSMDESPRIHAMNIALLSAETINWEVFLKAHLDIMNDRFERVSDGSYAWGKRQTYLKELEELNIEVKDLLFGITFRLSNPADHHYFASIGRLGRALAESKNKADIEKAMLAVMSDKSLDDYNRLLFYFLFLNYNHHLQEKTLQKKNEQNLAVAAKTLPDYLQEQLKQRKED